MDVPAEVGQLAVGAGHAEPVRLHARAALARQPRDGEDGVRAGDGQPEQHLLLHVLRLRRLPVPGAAAAAAAGAAGGSARWPTRPPCPRARGQAYAARFPNGGQTPNLFGDINSAHWYSSNVGPVHFLSLNSLMPYQPGTPQYAFIQADLAAVNRAVTPWVRPARERASAARVGAHITARACAALR